MDGRKVAEPMGAQRERQAFTIAPLAVPSGLRDGIALRWTPRHGNHRALTRQLRLARFKIRRARPHLLRSSVRLILKSDYR
jgi:hypothetical protein